MNFTHPDNFQSSQSIQLEVAANHPFYAYRDVLLTFTGTSCRISGFIKRNLDNAEIAYPTTWDISLRFGPGHNCGMVEISNLGIIVSQYNLSTTQNSMELLTVQQRKNILFSIEHMLVSSPYRRSIIIGNDKVDGIHWDFVKEYGYGWEMFELSRNINYQDSTHRVGVYWKRIGLFNYPVGICDKYEGSTLEQPEAYDFAITKNQYYSRG